MSNDNLKFSLRSIVEKNKLNGTNFLDWERNLRIILRSEGREDVLATPVPTNAIHMNGLKHDLNELHSMLKNAEGNIIGDKKKEVLNVNNGKGFKRVAKSKSNYQGKSKQVAKPKNGEKPKPKDTGKETVQILGRQEKRDCHISVNRMKNHKDGLLKDMDYESIDTCESCLMGKMTRSPFKGTFERATELLGVIHTDVCRPMSTEARGGYRYFITFTDE
uniref:GAG-pre-integrase domain-containing protein n=1 Tax=Salix viminalis TaxID=40686 RepID=A0A6N2MGC4_SALVM